MCEPPASALGAPESIGGLGTLEVSRARRRFTPSMFDRAVHRAFGWAFIRAVKSDRRQCPVRLRGASSADRDGQVSLLCPGPSPSLNETPGCQTYLSPPAAGPWPPPTSSLEWWPRPREEPTHQNRCGQSGDHERKGDPGDGVEIGDHERQPDDADGHIQPSENPHAAEQLLLPIRQDRPGFAVGRVSVRHTEPERNPRLPRGCSPSSAEPARLRYTHLERCPRPTMVRWATGVPPHAITGTRSPGSSDRSDHVAKSLAESGPTTSIRSAVLTSPPRSGIARTACPVSFT